MLRLAPVCQICSQIIANLAIFIFILGQVYYGRFKGTRYYPRQALTLYIGRAHADILKVLFLD